MKAWSERLDGALPKLKKLEVGGEIKRDITLALFSTTEVLEEFSCVILQNGKAGQDSNAGGLLFFSGIQHRLTNLKVLHLCKLAGLHEDHDEVMRLGRPFDTEDDRAVLTEWTDLIRCVSGTLEELTLEDRYLVHEEKME